MRVEYVQTQLYWEKEYMLGMHKKKYIIEISIIPVIQIVKQYLNNSKNMTAFSV